MVPGDPISCRRARLFRPPSGWGFALLAIALLAGAGGAAAGSLPGSTSGDRALPALPHAAHPVAPHRPRATYLDGVDVSSYQGTINWATVYGDGITFAFAKAAEGTTCTDSDFVNNAVNGKAAGVYIGAYDFAELPTNTVDQYCPSSPATDNATAEANYFTGVASPYFADGYMYPALDLENGCSAEGQGSLSVQQLSSWVGQWVAAVQAAMTTAGFPGVHPTIYMSASYAANCIEPWITQFPLWVANWNVGSPGTGIYSTWAYWQYNDDCTTCGVAGDADYFNGDLTQLQGGYVFGTSSPTVSYAVQDLTTSTALYCGGTFAAGNNIQFTATVTGGTSPYTYAWTYGDGTSGTGNPATHVYSAAGTVNPLLTVTDAKGKTGSTGSGCTFTVTAPPSVSVSFAVSPSASGGAIVVGGTTYTNGQSSTYAPGTAVAISATVPAGYLFSSWSTAGSVTVASASSSTTSMNSGASGGTLTLNLQTAVTLTFATSPSSEGGIQLGGSTFTNGQTDVVGSGSTAPITAVVPTGWAFLGWTVSGGLSVGSASQATTTLTIGSSGGTLTEQLVQLASVTVFVSPSSVGSVQVGSATATNGQTLGLVTGQVYPLVATVPAGMNFVGWSVNGTSLAVLPASDPQANLTVVDPSGGTLTATFAFPLPQAPLDLQVTGVAAGSVSLAWNAPPGPITNSTVFTAAGTSSGPTGPWGGTNVPGTGTTATIGGLAAGSTYWFEVAAWNASGLGAISSRVSQALLLPGAPVDLVVTANAQSWADLSWKAPLAGGEVLSYSLAISPSAGGSSQVDSFPSSVTTANATGLTPGASYSFQVFAVGEQGTGPGSNLANLTLSSPGGSGGKGSSGGGLLPTLPAGFPLASLGALGTAIWLAIAAAAIIAIALLARRRGREGGRLPPPEPYSPYAPAPGVGAPMGEMDVAPGPPPSSL
jgi:GH25 family lysozyme M1 (1,4-beta-N-acetylmuramidase)